MTYEATKTMDPGRSITVHLDTGSRRIQIQTAGHIDTHEQAAALPGLLQHLADMSRLPIRWGGAIYHPQSRVDPEAQQAWGGAA